MTPHAAKKIIQAALDSMHLPYTKLTARTIGFSDLARGSCIFVKVHGWQPGDGWTRLKDIARENGFCIE